LDKSLIDRISKKATVIGALILIIFVFSGWAIMEFFSISIGSLKIAGGLLMLIISIDILFGRRSREYYEKKGRESIDIDSIAVFPLALPLYSGPGAITAVVVLSSNTDLIGKLLVIVSIAIIYITVRITHIYAISFLKILGKSGADIIAKIMAIILAALSMEFIMDGITSKLATNV